MHDEPASATGEGLKIIGAGFGRTGTASMKAALDTLGFGPCYHMREVIGHPDRVALWSRIIGGEPADWPAVFAGYRSCVDWPACSFYTPLMDVYPEARVLLTVRDPAAWYESVLATIYRTRELARRLADGTFVAPSGTTEPTHALMVTELIWKQTFDDRFENRDYALSVYQAHNEEVVRRVPPDRLLVYETGAGWEPLCAFLGVAVPTEPFPRLNDRMEFQARIQSDVPPAPGVSGADQS